MFLETKLIKTDLLLSLFGVALPLVHALLLCRFPNIGRAAGPDSRLTTLVHMF